MSDQLVTGTLRGKRALEVRQQTAPVGGERAEGDALADALDAQRAARDEQASLAALARLGGLEQHGVGPCALLGEACKQRRWIGERSQPASQRVHAVCCDVRDHRSVFPAAFTKGSSSSIRRSNS